MGIRKSKFHRTYRLSSVSDTAGVEGGQGAVLVSTNSGHQVSRDRIKRATHLRAPLDGVDYSFGLMLHSIDAHHEYNGRKHNTSLYQLNKKRKALVVRRGDAFKLTLHFDRAFNTHHHRLKLSFETGKSPRLNKGSRVVVPVDEESHVHDWRAVPSYSGFSVNVEVTPSINCAVARWNLHVIIAHVGPNGKVTQHLAPAGIFVYILYNPWNIDDAVYMGDPVLREECILNDHGVMYKGTTSRTTTKPWHFGQFADFVLDCVMDLLGKSRLSHFLRGSPEHVARTLSALTNSKYDTGVVMGNWSGDYEDGTAPVSWVGSVAILHQYHDTHYPVKYGQCWVFAGVLTTMCRTLGIPCRPVSCFSAAHDCDASITVDVYWNKQGDTREDMNCDSIWNFHVWNEVWMSRGDLAAGYSGWQVVDATPQERSADGQYTVGPCSVAAIKQGIVQLPYDSPFVYAEVNADVIHWLAHEDGDLEMLQRKTDVVGRKICTRQASSDHLIDITHCYKHQEGTEAERSSFTRALINSKSHLAADIIDGRGVSLELDVPNSIAVGDDIHCVIRWKNGSTKSHQLAIGISVSVITYTGSKKAVIKKSSAKLIMGAGEENILPFEILQADYLEYLGDLYDIKVSYHGRVIETAQKFLDYKIFPLVRPSIHIKVPVADNIKKSQHFDVSMQFRNPLDITLTSGVWRIEYSSSPTPLNIMHNKVVRSHEVVTHDFQLVLEEEGNVCITAGFCSKQLSGVSGSLQFSVHFTIRLCLD